jgi:hypothetical protein
LIAVLDRALRALERVLLHEDFGEGLRERPGNEREAMLAEFDRRCEEIDTTRRDMIAEAAESLHQSSGRILHPALSEFAESAKRELAAALPAEACRLQEARNDAFADQLTEWLLHQLEVRASSWIEQYGPRLERAVHAKLAALEPALASLPERLDIAAREVFTTGPATAAANRNVRATAEIGTNDERTIGDRWQPPPFEATDSAWKQQMRRGVSLDSQPIFLLPGWLARRAALARIRHQANALAEWVCEVLKQRMSVYVESSIRSLDQSSAHALGEARKQIEAIIQPANSGRESGTHPQDAELQQARERLTLLRDALLASGTLDDSADLAVQPRAAAVPAIEALRRDAPGVQTAGKRRSPRATPAGASCSLCAAVVDAVFDFLCDWQHRLATESSAQHAFRAAGGFCSVHMWMLERVSSPRGLAGGIPPLLEANARTLSTLVGVPAATAAARVAELRGSEVGCFVCDVARRTEQTAGEQVVADLSNNAGTGQFGGVCLGHLQLLLAGTDDKVAGELLRDQSRRLGKVAEAMEGYALKVDARRRGLLTGAEERAYRDAIVLLAGERDIAFGGR